MAGPGPVAFAVLSQATLRPCTWRLSVRPRLLPGLCALDKHAYREQMNPAGAKVAFGGVSGIGVSVLRGLQLMAGQLGALAFPDEQKAKHTWHVSDSAAGRSALCAVMPAAGYSATCVCASSLGLVGPITCSCLRPSRCRRSICMRPRPR